MVEKYLRVEEPVINVLEDRDKTLRARGEKNSALRRHSRRRSEPREVDGDLLRFRGDDRATKCNSRWVEPW